MKLPGDFKEFIALLNAHGVRYVVVGGYAVAFHGYPRYTGDIDFFVEPTEENSRNVERVIRALGFTVADLTARDFISRDRIVQLGVAPVRIDLVTSIEAVPFVDAWASRGRRSRRRFRELPRSGPVAEKQGRGESPPGCRRRASADRRRRVDTSFAATDVRPR